MTYSISRKYECPRSLQRLVIKMHGTHNLNNSPRREMVNIIAINNCKIDCRDNFYLQIA